jgi:hypothetical protein
MRAVMVLLVFLLFPLSPALADCINPAGEEGVQVYNTTYKTMQFCNGTNWIAMGGSIAPGGRETMNEGWPDAIQCTIHSQITDADDTLTLFAYYMPYGDGYYYYRALEDIAAPFGESTLNTVTQIKFNPDKTFDSIGSTRNGANIQNIYAYADAGTCQGKSIADLYAEGKAFNFLGHNGG